MDSNTSTVKDMTPEQIATADADGNPTINANVAPPVPGRPQQYRFVSNFTKIVEAFEKSSSKKPKEVLQSLASLTSISFRLMMGFYTGKFTPTIKEACRIAQQLNVNVEGIWYLLPIPAAKVGG